jgi:hypothetical protein
VNALKITEQVAVFEAKIFADKSDAEPISNYVAARRATGKTGILYVEDAQNAAVAQALFDAVFGIQFCDAGQIKHTEIQQQGDHLREEGDIARSPVAEMQDPADKPQTVAAEPAPMPERPAETAGSTADRPERENGEERSEAESQSQSSRNLPEAVVGAELINDGENPEPESAVRQPEDEISDAKPFGIDIAESTDITISIANEVEENVETVIEEPGAVEIMTGDSENPEASAGWGSAEPQTSPPNDETAYLPEIRGDETYTGMTLEEAEATVVDSGVCKGWPLSKVANERPASLKWYVNGNPGGSDVLRAASKLILESRELQKAG